MLHLQTEADKTQAHVRQPTPHIPAAPPAQISASSLAVSTPIMDRAAWNSGSFQILELFALITTLFTFLLLLLLLYYYNDDPYDHYDFMFPTILYDNYDGDYDHDYSQHHHPDCC